MSDPTNYKWAHRRIKRLWSEDKTEIRSHAQLRMSQREIDIFDIQNVVHYGRIVEHSKPMQLWRYGILGKAIDGARMKVVVEINGSLVIVTVI